MLVPVKLSVPVPAWVTLPVPEMTLAKFVPCVRVFERLNVSVPLLAIALEVESAPVVPPFPGCRTRKSRILAECVFFWLVYCLVTRQNY